MDQSHVTFLTPFNYFDWKYKMVIQVKSISLYKVTMGVENGPKSTIEKSKFFNIMDEAFRMLCLIILRDLLFHVNCLTTPNDVWLKLEFLFGNIDELRGHRHENELITLNLTHFCYILFKFCWRPNNSP